MAITGDYNFNFKPMYGYPQQNGWNSIQTQPLNGGFETSKETFINTNETADKNYSKEYGKETSVIERIFNSIWNLFGVASTETLEKAATALETLSELEELKYRNYDNGYEMHQAFKNDASTARYSNLDRELYPVIDANTIALA